MMSRREALDADLRMLERTAGQKDPDGQDGKQAMIIRRASGFLWRLFCEIESEPHDEFLGLRNRKRVALIQRFNDVAMVVGFNSYERLPGR